MSYRVELFPSKRKNWYLRIRASNGQILFTSQRYAAKKNAKKTQGRFVAAAGSDFKAVEVDK